MALPEQVIYQSPGVVVTDSRAELAGTTYSIAHITSASKVTQKAEGGSACIVICGGGVIALAGLGLVAWPEMRTIGAIVALVGVAAIVIGACFFRPGPPTYVLRIGLASGEVDGLRSQDSKAIDTILGAIETSMGRRK